MARSKRRMTPQPMDKRLIALAVVALLLAVGVIALAH